MYFLAILIAFVPVFFDAMEKPCAVSQSEKKFLEYVLKVSKQDQFHVIEILKSELNKQDNLYQLQKEYLEKQLAQLKSNWDYLQTTLNKERELKSWLEDIECGIRIDKEKKVQAQKEYDKLTQEKDTYEQFIQWHTTRSSSEKLRDLRFLFSKMAAENNVEGMKAIEALALEWKLIANTEQKLEKLDYLDALTDAVKNGKADATEYLMNKKNISLKDNATLISQICRGKWGISECNGYKETQQKTIVQLMIKKGAASRKAHIDAYLKIARESESPERLIKYLEEVARSRWY